MVAPPAFIAAPTASLLLLPAILGLTQLTASYLVKAALLATTPHLVVRLLAKAVRVARTSQVPGTKRLARTVQMARLALRAQQHAPWRAPLAISIRKVRDAPRVLLGSTQMSEVAQTVPFARKATTTLTWVKPVVGCERPFS
jgi:hypothetical protein